MKSNLTLPAVGAALVAPFVVLQWINRRAYEEEFPFLLFTFMSLHAVLIVLALTPAVRRLRAHRSLGALHLGHWVGLVLGAVLVYAYGAVVRADSGVRRGLKRPGRRGDEWPELPLSDPGGRGVL